MPIGRSQMRQQVSKPPQKKKWSKKRKKKINCDRPKGFRERDYCQGKKKRQRK